jgi:hypothetical protein
MQYRSSTGGRTGSAAIGSYFDNSIPFMWREKLLVGLGSECYRTATGRWQVRPISSTEMTGGRGFDTPQEAIMAAIAFLDYEAPPDSADLIPPWIPPPEA